MMRDVKKTSEILKAMRKVITVPFTIKIRSGWDQEHLNAVEVSKMAETSGLTRSRFIQEPEPSDSPVFRLGT